jgi:hypothetical protein
MSASNGTLPASPKLQVAQPDLDALYAPCLMLLAPYAAGKEIVTHEKA